MRKIHSLFSELLFNEKKTNSTNMNFVTEECISILYRIDSNPMYRKMKCNVYKMGFDMIL